MASCHCRCPWAGSVFRVQSPSSPPPSLSSEEMAFRYGADRCLPWCVCAGHGGGGRPGCPRPLACSPPPPAGCLLSEQWLPQPAPDANASCFRSWRASHKPYSVSLRGLGWAEWVAARLLEQQYLAIFKTDLKGWFPYYFNLGPRFRCPCPAQEARGGRTVSTCQ